MILVIGAGGFIGAYLVDALKEQGKEVYPVDKVDAPLAYCEDDDIDITCSIDLEYLSWDKITSVVNLASLQPANDDGTATLADYLAVNAIGLCNILEQCRIHGIKRVIHCISVKPMRYTGEYANLTISERAALDCINRYNIEYQMEVLALELPPVYGYGPHLEIYKNGKPQKTGFATFIEKARKGESLEVWGDSKATRQIIYIKDVVNVIIKALDDSSIRCYGIRGIGLSLREEAEIIARVFVQDKVSPIIFKPEIPNGIREESYYWINDIWPMMGQPQYDFEAMCRDFIKEERRGRYKWLVEKRQRMMGGKRC